MNINLDDLKKIQDFIKKKSYILCWYKNMLYLCIAIERDTSTKQTKLK